MSQGGARAYRPEIDLADQFGFACLGIFHRCHDLLRCSGVRTEQNDASNDGCECANQDRGIKPDWHEEIGHHANSTASDGNLGEQHGLPAAIYAVGKLFDIGFEACDLIAQVTIGHTPH